MSDNNTNDSYANKPLPESMTVLGWRVALIILSFTFSLPGFLNSAETALALGFNKSVLVAFLAGVVLCVGACLTSVVSVCSRLTTYLLIKRSFGKNGAALVNLVIAFIHFCWFGINVSFFGDAMVAADNAGYGLNGNFQIYVILASIVIAISTVYGFKTLDRLAMIVVPFVGVILLTACWLILKDNPVNFDAAKQPHTTMKNSYAASINYLFTQSKFYTESFLSDQTFLNEIRGHIGKSSCSKKTDFLNYIKSKISDNNGKDYNVSLWILYDKKEPKAPSKNDIPLIAKYELKLIYEEHSKD